MSSTITSEGAKIHEIFLLAQRRVELCVPLNLGHFMHRQSINKIPGLAVKADYPSNDIESNIFSVRQ